MGVVIYINGSIDAKEELTERQKSVIEHIVNCYEDDVFGAGTKNISFMYDTVEGSDPTEDCVIAPLKELISFADDENIILNGDISITSDWSDYDDQGIRITNNKLTYGNTQVWDADTSELIDELKARDEVVSGPSQKRCVELIGALISHIAEPIGNKQLVEELKLIGFNENELKDFRVIKEDAA